MSESVNGGLLHPVGNRVDSRADRRGRQMMLLVAGVLGVSSVLGVALNQGLAAASRTEVASEAPESGESTLREDRRQAIEAIPAANMGSAGTEAPAPPAMRHSSVQRLPELRFTDITPPENPFRPSTTGQMVGGPMANAPQASTGGLESFSGAPALPPVFSAPAEASLGGQAPRTTAKSAKAARPAPRAEDTTPVGPRADELAVTGIIQGDPAIAVVRFGGQSLFLKIGDQVADTWRLAAIGERSATFLNGEQRVEIPIKGGNSQ